MTVSVTATDHHPLVDYILRAVLCLLIASGTALVVTIALLLWSGILTW